MLQLARGLPFINSTGSTIGPGSALEVTGTTQEEGEIVLAIKKPTYEGIGKRLIVFNGETDIPNNGGGFAQVGHLILALKTGSPALGDIVGPVNDEWYVSTKGSGYIYLGDDPTGCFTDSCVLMIDKLAGKKLFLTTSTITAATGSSSPWTPGTGTGTMCERYDDSGTIKTRTTSITGVTLLHDGPDSIASGRLVQCKMIDGFWTIDVDYC